MGINGIFSRYRLISFGILFIVIYMSVLFNFHYFTNVEDRNKVSIDSLSTSNDIFGDNLAVIGSILSPENTFPTGMEFDSNGYLWLVGHSSQKIYKINSTTGDVIANFSTPGPNPWGLTFDDEGMILHSDYNQSYTDPDRIYRIDPSTGEVISSFASPCNFTTGICYDSGLLYVGGFYDPQTYIVNATTGEELNTFSSSIKKQTGIEYHEGNLWVSGESVTETLFKIDPQNYSIVWEKAFPSDIVRCEGITFDQNHHLWVADSSYREIFELEITSDIESPVISVISPENNSICLKNQLWLNFTINELTDWIGYSLDGNDNLTITGNTLLTELSEGTHFVIIYANDSAGNMGYSERTWFTIDTSIPEISIISPTNTSYSNQEIWLNFTINELTDWIGYSLDHGSNITISGNILLNLTEGHHSIIIHANDTSGNMGHSNRIEFTIDKTSPSITILSPTNSTYGYQSIWLNYTVDEATSWVGYSLDSAPVVTISEPVMLNSISEGSHTIIVYAYDSVGNIGESVTLQFTIDLTPPVIHIEHPLNNTFFHEYVWLNFSINEPVSWIGYSLHGFPNITITDNILLGPFIEGRYSLIIYANDSSGHMGQSTTIWFSIDTTLPDISISNPINNTVYNYQNLWLNFTIDENTSWIGYSLNGASNVTVEENILLTSIQEGSHYLIIYAYDLAGNVDIDSISFTVDTTPPIVTIISPNQDYYNKTDLTITWSIEPGTIVDDIIIDGVSTILVNNSVRGFSEGIHNITLVVEDIAGNELVISQVFTVDVTNPVLEILSPLPQTYDQAIISLIYSCDEEISLISISIDGAIVSVLNNTQMTNLSEGEHSITITVTDLAGNTAQALVTFSIEFPITTTTSEAGTGFILIFPALFVLLLILRRSRHL